MRILALGALALYFAIIAFTVVLAQQAQGQTTQELARAYALQLPGEFSPELLAQREAILVGFADALLRTTHKPKRVEMECPAGDPVIRPAVVTRVEGGQRLKYHVPESYGGPLTVWIHEGYHP